MNAATILALLKSILPTKKIGAWIVGILGALVALVLGVSNSDLKKQYCASEAVELPKLEVVAPAPAVEAPKPGVK
jgi:hypothetical protein